MPLTLGHEIAGVAKEFGPDADSKLIREGDRVVVYPWIGCGSCRKCLAGAENLCEGQAGFLGFQRDGGYAEYVLVPNSRYLVKNERFEAGRSALLACSCLTAFNSVRLCGLMPDDLLVVIGAGGVGTMAIQIAKKTASAKVAAVDIDDSKLELALQVGADYIFNSSKLSERDLVSKVKGVNQGRGPEAVADFVGKPATSSLGFRLLGHGSRLVIVGLGGGSVKLPLPLFPLRASQVLGSFTGTLSDLRQVLKLAEKRIVVPVISGVYHLEDANEVLARLEQGEIKGRALLRP